MIHTLTTDWTDISTAESMTADADYAGQALYYDVVYRTDPTANGMPDAGAEGFVMLANDRVSTYTYKANTTLWMRRRDAGAGACKIIIEAE